MKAFSGAITMFLILSIGCKSGAIAQSNAIGVTGGYAVSDLHWSIAGNADGGSPNILSELVWEKMRGAAFGIHARYYFKSRWAAELNLNYHDVKKGRVNDKDYLEDDRQSISYNERFNSEGYNMAMQAVINYDVLRSDKFLLQPFIGYELLKQKAMLLGDERSEEGLKSSYKNTWVGGVAGLNIRGVFKNFDIGTKLSGGLLHYEAEALWNLIPDFQKPVSFIHSTGGYSLKGRFEAGYTFNKRLRLNAYYNLFHADAWKGLDRSFYTNRESIDTKLNWVTTTVSGSGVGLSYLF